ncbi:hypothetical protein GCM10009087_05050 [Sphingomonas oligophenolica]
MCRAASFYPNFSSNDLFMTIKKDITLSEHMRRAVKARWAKTTPEQRSEYARKMVAAREAKRQKPTNPS